MTWISVKDRLPEQYVGVLLVDSSSLIDAGHLSLYNSELGWWVDSRMVGLFCYTHWMPLPEPPKA